MPRGYATRVPKGPENKLLLKIELDDDVAHAQIGPWHQSLKISQQLTHLSFRMG